MWFIFYPYWFMDELEDIYTEQIYVPSSIEAEGDVGIP